MKYEMDFIGIQEETKDADAIVFDIMMRHLLANFVNAKTATPPRFTHAGRVAFSCIKYRCYLVRTKQHFL